MSFQQTIVEGHLGDNPEVRYTGGGTPVATFDVATTERWTDRDTNEPRERTEWHKIKVFGKTVENFVAKYVKKGSHVLVVGRNRTEDYVGKDDGVKRYITYVYADDIRLLDRKPADAGAPPQQEPANA
jgi:single-strand DNA-binding protein